MPSFESGNFKLEYAGNFPDQLKLIKTFEVFPLEITAIGSLNPRSHKWSYSVGCRVGSTTCWQQHNQQHVQAPDIHACMLTCMLTCMPACIYCGLIRYDASC
jgi:hypothetical protein